MPIEFTEPITTVGETKAGDMGRSMGCEIAALPIEHQPSIVKQIIDIVRTKLEHRRSEALSLAKQLEGILDDIPRPAALSKREG